MAMTEFPKLPDAPNSEMHVDDSHAVAVVVEEMAEAIEKETPTDTKPPFILRFFKGLAKGIAKPLFYLLSIGLTGLVIGSIIAFALFHYYSKDLPDSSSLANYNPAGMTRFYSNDGSLIAEYAKQRRIYTPFDDISPMVINAFIAAEDKNFYSHRGVDPEGIARAVYSNIQRYRDGDNSRSLVGGSTITQQVVKNFLLTREKSLERKIKEAILAMRITQTYSKDRILELYLNEIYLGLGAYGVAAASLEYFGKELHELQTEEAALLAGMPQAPSKYNPLKNPKEALYRRNYAITRMYEDGYINQAEYERAMAAEMVISEEPLISEPKAPFFSEEVRRWVAKEYDEDTLYNKSLFVKTTVDLAAQDIMDKALRDALVAYDRRHGYRGALVRLDGTDNWRESLQVVQKDTPLFGEQQVAVVLEVQAGKAVIGVMEKPEDEDSEPKAMLQNIPFADMKWARPLRASGSLGPIPKKPSDIVAVGDVVLVSPLEAKDQWRLEQIPEVSGAMVAMRPQTGEVVAMSGGYSFDSSQFNRATQAKRQPGSSFKPFVYMAALERGFTPSSIVVDAPVEISQGPGKPLWKPKNYGERFYGPTTLRVGLEKSRNVMTVKLAQKMGLEKVKAIGERFNIYKDAPLHYSMVLGSHETTVLDLVAGYSMLVNGGLKVSPVMVKRIDGRDGKTIYRADQRACTRCNQEQGDAISMNAPPVIKDNRERAADPRVAYQMVTMLEGVVQRGTAVRAKALELPMGGKTGTTNESRDAWFVGFTQDLVVGVYVGFDNPTPMGKKETGGKVALPAFMDFMKSYYEDRTALEFIQPSGILQVQVDRKTGVPPMPWQYASGPLITETFVTGGSIFVPGEEIDLEVPEVPTQMEYVNYDYERDVYIEGDELEGEDPYGIEGSPDEIQQRRYDPYSTKQTEQAQPSEQRWERAPPWQRQQTERTLPPRHPSRAFEDRRSRRDYNSPRNQRPSYGTGGLY